MSPRRWPAPLVELGSHPEDVAPPWAEHVRGISQGSGWWFVTQADRLWRVPMARELGDADPCNPEVTTVGIPEAGVDHLGDCDVHDGRLYVAMEGRGARVGLFDLDLRYRGSAPVAEQGHDCPWCAVDTPQGLLYTSPFHTDRLHVYRPTACDDGLVLDHVAEVLLRSGTGERLRVSRVQGGAFSPHGHLFLTSDTRAGGLLGIDIATGRCRMHVEIPFEPEWPDEDVIEGVTVVDLSDGTSPWMGGVVHALVFDDHGPRPDYVWLRHFDVAGDADRGHCRPPAPARQTG